MNKTHLTRSLRKAVDWSWQVRNPDFGWGDTEGNPSNPMGSSELLIGLIAAGEKIQSTKMGTSISYVEHKIKKDVIRKATRSVVWSANLLLSAGRLRGDIYLDKLASKLTQYRLKNHGWPRIEADTEANIFDSAIALRTLLNYGYPPSDALQRSVEWITRAVNADGGWGFHTGEESNPVCTAQCIITLGRTKTSASIIEKGSRFLQQSTIQTGGWNGINEQVGPTLGWKYFHHTNPWGIIALLSAGATLKNRELQAALQALIRSQNSEGYWKILPDTHSIPSTGNALMALSQAIT